MALLQQAKFKMSLLIKGQTSSEKYHRGFQIYQDHKIMDITQEGSIFYAKAKGNKYYSLWIDLERYYGECDCPSDTFQEKCKHVAALAFALVDEDYNPPKSKAVIKQKAKTTAEKKAAPKKVSKPRSPYTKALGAFIESASMEVQLAVFYQLLKNNKSLQSQALMLIESQKVNIPAITKFLAKHVKVFGQDFNGSRTKNSILEIKSYFQELESAFTEDNKGYEDRLKVAELMADKLLYEWSFQEFFVIYNELLAPIFLALEQNLEELLPSMEHALKNSSNGLLWEALLEKYAEDSCHSHNLQQIIWDYIEISNIKKSIVFDTSEQFQRRTIAHLISHLTQENPFLEALLEECDFITDKRHYYKMYYQHFDLAEKYLEYCENPTLESLDKESSISLKYAVQTMQRLERWDLLKQTIEILRNNLEISYIFNSVWTDFDLLALNAKAIRELEINPEKELLLLYEYVRKATISPAIKARFFWVEKKYLELEEYFKWYREQSLVINNYRFKSTEVKNELLAYLRYLYQIEEPEITVLFKRLLEIEKHYLRETQSNVYEFTYDLFEYACAHGLKEELIEFMDYCANKLPNRKKLNEVLEDLASRNDLI